MANNRNQKGRKGSRSNAGNGRGTTARADSAAGATSRGEATTGASARGEASCSSGRGDRSSYVVFCPSSSAGARTGRVSGDLPVGKGVSCSDSESCSSATDPTAASSASSSSPPARALLRSSQPLTPEVLFQVKSALSKVSAPVGEDIQAEKGESYPARSYGMLCLDLQSIATSIKVTGYTPPPSTVIPSENSSVVILFENDLLSWTGFNSVRSYHLVVVAKDSPENPREFNYVIDYTGFYRTSLRFEKNNSGDLVVLDEEISAGVMTEKKGEGEDMAEEGKADEANEDQKGEGNQDTEKKKEEEEEEKDMTAESNADERIEDLNGARDQDTQKKGREGEEMAEEGNADEGFEDLNGGGDQDTGEKGEGGSRGEGEEGNAGGGREDQNEEGAQESQMSVLMPLLESGDDFGDDWDPNFLKKMRERAQEASGRFRP